MTEFGFRFLLFSMAILLSLAAIFLEPRGDGKQPRLEYPKVVISFPGASKLFEIAKSIEKAKALFEMIKSSDGTYDPEGFVIAGDFEKAIPEGMKLGEVEIHEIVGERILILGDFEIVVVGK